jgi:hypothetical protein
MPDLLGSENVEMSFDGVVTDEMIEGLKRDYYLARMRISFLEMVQNQVWYRNNVRKSNQPSLAMVRVKLQERMV